MPRRREVAEIKFERAWALANELYPLVKRYRDNRPHDEEEIVWALAIVMGRRFKEKRVDMEEFNYALEDHNNMAVEIRERGGKPAALRYARWSERYYSLGRGVTLTPRAE
jgi:hypothetical protein